MQMRVLSLDHMPWVATLLRRAAIVQNTSKLTFEAFAHSVGAARRASAARVLPK